MCVNIFNKPANRKLPSVFGAVILHAILISLAQSLGPLEFHLVTQVLSCLCMRTQNVPLLTPTMPLTSWAGQPRVFHCASDILSSSIG